MLTKAQFLALFSIYILYTLAGAAIFYHFEGIEEAKNRETAKKERIEIEELLSHHYVPSDSDIEEEILEKLTTYCGKPITNNMIDVEDPPKWDYYHSVFFVITSIATVGYGNLAPTTMFTRMFLIFYAFVGIPINGLVVLAIGGYFGKSFESLYNRWKNTNTKNEFARLGLITQIILYLLPGFMFFIFIPAMIFMFFEGWAYDVSVYYAFVSLTTIGFGDYCAGTETYDYSNTVTWMYKLFLLFWIIIGLGYLSMILTYISRAMTSRQLERLISTHVRKTPLRIRDELRSLLNETRLGRIKRVYKHSLQEHPEFNKGRSGSYPDLSTETLWNAKRKRALSECPQGRVLKRIHSDTDLQLIDKEKTFSGAEIVTGPSELLLRVVNALGNGSDGEEGGVHMFSDSQILRSENTNFEWVDKHNLTWYGQSASQKLQELKERANYYERPRRKTLAAPIPQPSSLISMIKNTFKDDRKKHIDVENQDYLQRTPRGRWSILVDEQDRYLQQAGRLSMFSHARPPDEVLERTSIAEFIRALTAISVPDGAQQKVDAVEQNFRVGSTASPLEVRRLEQRRRGSLLPPTIRCQDNTRRFSLRPVVEDNLSGVLTKELKEESRKKKYGNKEDHDMPC